jgi:DNA polymerase-4
VHPNDPRKSVSNERTFATDVRLSDEVDAVLDSISAKVGQRLRQKSLTGRTVTVKMRFSDFSTKTVRRTLERATDDEFVFGPIARELVHESWSTGVGLRLLGVGISGFEERAVQLDLLGADDSGEEEVGVVDTPPEPRPRSREGLVRGIDAVRERFGDDAVRFGRELKKREDTDTPRRDR